MRSYENLEDLGFKRIGDEILREYTFIPCGRIYMNDGLEESIVDIVFRNSIPYEKPNLEKIRNIYLELIHYSSCKYFIGDTIYSL